MTTLYRTSGGALLMNGSNFRLCCCGPQPTPITCGGHNFRLPTTMTLVFPNVSNKPGCTTCNGKGGSQALDLATPSPLTAACFAGTCCIFTWRKFVSFTQIYELQLTIPVDGVTDIVARAAINSECGFGPNWRLATIPWQSNFAGFSASLPYDGGTDCNGVTGTTVSVSG